MTSVRDVATFLESFAPLHLAAEWDNVGLLVGDAAAGVERVLTCLTVTPAVAAQAVRERVNLIVTHHPLPFRPLKRLTAAEPTGRILLSLIAASVAIYSPHTAFDSATGGINAQLAAALGLTGVQPIVAQPGADIGSGRWGSLPRPRPLAEIAGTLKAFLKIPQLQRVGSADLAIERVAIACGSAGEFLGPALALGCQLLITGETRLHTCYEAEAQGAALLLTGHYASERFGVENLAHVLSRQFQNLKIWPSQDEKDPLDWL